MQAQPLETQSYDWVLSFKSKEIFPFQGMRASCPQARMTRHPQHSATYIEPQPLVLDFVVSKIVRSMCPAIEPTLPDKDLISLFSVFIFQILKIIKGKHLLNLLALLMMFLLCE